MATSPFMLNDKTRKYSFVLQPSIIFILFRDTTLCFSHKMGTEANDPTPFYLI